MMTSDGGVSDAGGHCVPPEAMFDQSCANAVVSGTEFILDAETHWFDASDLANFPAYIQAFGPLFAITTEDNYVNSLFCNSDTAVACLLPWPGIECTPTRQTGCGLPITNERIAASRDKINALAGNTQRVLNHALVLPQDPSGIDAQLAIMEEMACLHGVAAWQLYPGFKPGFRFDDRAGGKCLRGDRDGVRHGHERSESIRPLHRQAPEVPRPGQRALGHRYPRGLDDSTGPDRNVPDAHHPASHAGPVRLSRAHSGDQGEGIRPERSEAIRRRSERRAVQGEHVPMRAKT